MSFQAAFRKCHFVAQTRSAVTFRDFLVECLLDNDWARDKISFAEKWKARAKSFRSPSDNFRFVLLSLLSKSSNVFFSKEKCHYSDMTQKVSNAPYHKQTFQSRLTLALKCIFFKLFKLFIDWINNNQMTLKYLCIHESKYYLDQHLKALLVHMFLIGLGSHVSETKRFGST